jgi:bifunctional non-homologous end joining protein LigD
VFVLVGVTARVIAAVEASFVEPMLLQRCADLPDGKPWLIELKLDGFRAIGFKTGGKVCLRSRNNKDFNGRYPTISQVSPACRMTRCSMEKS